MDKADAFCRVRATAFQLVGTTSAIFSIGELSDTIWVEADNKYINSEWNLIHVFPFRDEQTDLREKMQLVDNNSPWFEFPTEELNLEIGFHMYKLIYENTYTHQLQDLYFGYTIQNSNPDTSNYIYMDAVRHEEDS